MRVLLYGMQSSGASLITYFLGQAPRSVALVDVWARHLTPDLPDGRAEAVIAKCVVTTGFSFEEHLRSFRPDRTILVLRHPAQNYESLRRKGYIDEGGPIDEKFAKLEEVFRERGRFDLTLAYEDFVADPERTVAALRGAGISAELDYYRFRRSTRKIRAFNFAHDPWCAERYGFGWGFGNVQGTQLNAAKLYRPASPEVEARVRELCPSVCSFYDTRFPDLESAARASEAEMRTGATRPHPKLGWRARLLGSR